MRFWQRKDSEINYSFLNVHLSKFGHQNLIWIYSIARDPNPDQYPYLTNPDP
jgi:hypothetical protein